MKKLFLSFFAVMLAVFSMQAEEVTYTVDFSKYSGSSTQYKEETHDLGGGLSISIKDCHINTQLRIYSSSQNNGYVISDALPGTITSMSFNMGYKADNLNVYGSTDGSTWVEVGSIATTSSYKNYTLAFTDKYTYFKLDVKGTQQIRIASMTITYTTGDSGEGGETPDPETPVLTIPTVSIETGKTIELNSQINISAPAEGNTVSYSINNGEEVALTEAKTITADKAGVMTLVIKSTCGEETGTETYTYNVKPTKPTISATGESFNLGESLNVEISATEGIIYYTTDGNDPTESSNVYSPAIIITETTTVKAIAVVDGVASDVVAATYTAIDPNAKTANVVAADLGYENAADIEKIQIGDYITVTFEKGTSQNTTKYYTSDKSIRNYNGNLITFSATEGVTINSIVFTASSASYKENPTDLSSGIVTIDGVVTTISNIAANTLSFTQSGSSRIQQIEVSYSIAKDAVIIANPTLPASSEFYGYIDVEITNNAEGTKLYYSTDNVEFVEYTQALNITETTTVYAYAQDAEDNKSGTVSATYTKVVPKKPTMPEAQSFTESFEISITATEGAEIYYTLDGNDPTTESTPYESTFTITETTTIKAIAVINGVISEVAEATYTLFVVEETAGYYVKVTSEPADWSGKYLIVYEDGTEAYVFNGKDAANGHVLATIDGDIIDANSEIDAVAVTIATMEGGYSIKTADGYIYGTSGSNKLNTNTTTPQLNTIELDANGAVITSGRVLQFNSDSGQKRFRYYTKDNQKPVQLYKYMESYDLSVTEAGWASLCLDFNATIPAGVEVYAVTDVKDGNWLAMTQVTGVLPANTGVLVKANQGDYVFNETEDAPATIEGNLLEGTTTQETANATDVIYVLAKVDDNVGLYKANTESGDFTIKANGAYLPASALTAEQQQSVGFRFDFATTAIEEVKGENGAEAIYDLQGRRIDKITEPGIYIVNGVKRVVR